MFVGYYLVQLRLKLIAEEEMVLRKENKITFALHVDEQFINPSEQTRSIPRNYQTNLPEDVSQWHGTDSGL
jgi:hypothetical protein